ncbi:hypothetical protein J22TS1_10560 [Siminovitchia terrae]|nr:hypothetical protein J22TS1_10560 [Siminovitchia terrae]
MKLNLQSAKQFKTKLKVKKFPVKRSSRLVPRADSVMYIYLDNSIILAEIRVSGRM